MMTIYDSNGKGLTVHAPGTPPGEPHTHEHTHARLEHSHQHYPDIHHRHEH